MLHDKLGRQFKKGQLVAFTLPDLTDAEVVDVKEASVMNADGGPLIEELKVVFSLRVPVPHPGLEVRTGNIVIVKEPEPKAVSAAGMKN